MNISLIIGLSIIGIILVGLIVLTALFVLKRGDRIIRFLGIVTNGEEQDYNLDRIKCFLAIICAITCFAMLLPVGAIIFEIFELFYLFAAIVVMCIIVVTILFGSDYFLN